MKKSKTNIKVAWVFLTAVLLNITTVSAELTFNEKQATDDIKRLLKPIANWGMLVATLVAGGFIAFQYLGWKAKDEDERPPFTKIVKKELFAYALVLGFGMIISWFTSN